MCGIGWWVPELVWPLWTAHQSQAPAGYPAQSPVTIPTEQSWLHITLNFTVTLTLPLSLLNSAFPLRIYFVSKNWPTLTISNAELGKNVLRRLSCLNVNFCLYTSVPKSGLWMVCVLWVISHHDILGRLQINMLSRPRPWDEHELCTDPKLLNRLTPY